MSSRALSHRLMPTLRTIGYRQASQIIKDKEGSETPLDPHIGAFAPNKLALPVARYGGRQTVTLIPGDGVGPEMVGHVQRAFKAAHAPVDFESTVISGLEDDDTALNNAMMSIERNGVCLMGNIETKSDQVGVMSRNVRLRRDLDLFAHMIHAKSISDIKKRYSNIDIVVIRENTEGEYSGMEHEAVSGVVESLKIVTTKNIERIARMAFEFAERNQRKKVTAVHKANIMKIADGKFLSVCDRIAKEYPNIEYNDMIVDNASMQLVSRPQQFDVMLMPNLYGNIISNIAVGLCGGPGLFSGRNLGDRYAVFETATRGTGTQLAGKNVANPIGFLRAGIDMLYFLGVNQSAQLLEECLFRTFCDNNIRTSDIGGAASTAQFVDAYVAEIKLAMKKVKRA